MDEIYIKKVCEGETKAFSYFLKKYKDMAFTVAFTIIRDEQYTEEVVQNAFIKAFKGMSSFKFTSKFSTWFYRIVINEAILFQNKRKRDILSFVPEYSCEQLDFEAVFNLNHNEQSTNINEALNMLSINESLILRLFYLEEASLKEISEMTGWTISKIKTILFRARKNMESAMTYIMKKNYKR